MAVVIDDLALVILAHNNPGFLARSVDYYRDLKCHKIIADSSSQAIYSSETAPAGYDYRHLPIGYYAKLRHVAATLTSPFVLAAGCDDFFVPEAMARFVAYLKAHPDVVSVSGQHIGFKAVNGNYGYFLKHSNEYLHLVARGLTDNVYHRLSTSLTPPYGLVYSVLRTEAWREVTGSQYTRSALTHTSLHDRYVPLILAALGNIVVLPEFFLARSVVDTPVVYEGYGRIHIRELMVDWPAGAKDEYFRVLGSIADILHRNHGVPLPEGAAFVDGVFSRAIWGMQPWNERKAGGLSDGGGRADAIDAELAVKGKLLVSRRDRMTTPFPEAEKLFPVYQAEAAVRDIQACVARHPVERNGMR